MKLRWPRQGQSRFWLICYQIQMRNERKLASTGSEQVFVDLLSNSIWKYKEIGIGYLSADFG